MTSLLWSSDLGDGTYRNPILYADYSDPDVIRHGEDFYMVASSFNCAPGLPVLHSRDLIHWTLIAHALPQLPGARFAESQLGSGAWAPSLRFHDGKFWIFFPMVEEGIHVTTATDPRGPWSEPHCLLPGRGLIDPCPFWDEDGQAYLCHAFAMSRSGIKEKLRLIPMSPDGRELLGEGQIVIDTPHHPYLEGPKLHKLNGYYYIMAPGGGVPMGWQVAFRSKNIWGPYEERIVLEQGSTAINGPHQGALIDLANGEWWFIHFQDAKVFGRIVHLQPVTWINDWPEMGVDHDGNGIGEPVTVYRKPGGLLVLSPVEPQTTDEFDQARLALQWQWNANPQESWLSLTARPGWLRLFAQPLAEKGLDHTGHQCLQKFPAPSFAVETLLEGTLLAEGEEAGLTVMGRDYASLALRATTTGWELIYREPQKITVLQVWPEKTVRLQVKIALGGVCRFRAINSAGEITVVPLPFQAKEGVWIGARVGLYVLGSKGSADFDYLRLTQS